MSVDQYVPGDILKHIEDDLWYLILSKEPVNNKLIRFKWKLFCFEGGRIIDVQYNGPFMEKMRLAY